MRKDYRIKISVTYYLSTFNIFDSIINNNYLSFTLSKTSVEVNVLLLVYVVTTTHHSRTNDLTTSKALQWAIK